MAAVFTFLLGLVACSRAFVTPTSSLHCEQLDSDVGFELCIDCSRQNWTTAKQMCMNNCGHLVSMVNQDCEKNLSTKQGEIIHKLFTKGNRSRWWSLNISDEESCSFLKFTNVKGHCELKKQSSCSKLSNVACRRKISYSNVCQPSTVSLCPQNSSQSSSVIPSQVPTASPSQPSNTTLPITRSNVAAIAGGVAGGCVVIVVVLVLVVVCVRFNGKQGSFNFYSTSEGKSDSSDGHSVDLTNINYDGSSSKSFPRSLANAAANYEGVEYHGDKTETMKTDVTNSTYACAYATTSLNSQSAVLSNGTRTSNRLSLGVAAPTSIQHPEFPDGLYDAVLPCDEQINDIYWQPAKSVEKLYAQFAGKKFRMIRQCDVVVRETLGSGEFGTVAKGTWTGSGSSAVVAVKMLNSTSADDRIRFLQEGAIMGQFKHKNIVALRGLVLDGEPIMAVIEFMENGDLKQYLQNCVSELSGLAKKLLRMCREIASGMEYLYQKAFIHRDLAVRNVMLDSKFTCKIGDFGLSRDLSDSEYYMTHGGKIPIRWTAPEAVMYRKYSAASDVWSYGIVLHEIWTVGQRPYDHSWNNDYVMKMLETGYRLPPPPGCSRAIYKLMISCWHPDRHLRPKFDQIVCELGVRDDDLLVNSPGVESIRGTLGRDVNSTDGLYDDLQRAYLGMSIVT